MLLEGEKMKVMSFNTQHCLNYLTRRIDYDVMAEAILAQSPDVVGLNEMRSDGEGSEWPNQTAKLSALTGLEHYYFAQAINEGGPYGNGFLSKIPILSAETILVPEPEGKKESRYEQRCLLKAKLENGFTVLVIHVGLSDPEKLKAVETVINNLPDEKVVLMGDFNMEPDCPILAPIRERMYDTAELFGEEKLSWPSVDPKVKIDYIFVSRDLLAESADIPPIVASDHRPYITEIKA